MYSSWSQDGSVGTAESELVVRESEAACFGAEVKEYGDRCRAEAFEPLRLFGRSNDVLKSVFPRIPPPAV